MTNERHEATRTTDATSPGESVTRRETLRRATAVLALGLGAPAGLLAVTGAPRASGYRLAFYEMESDRRVDVDIPDRVAKILTGDLTFNELKIEWFDGRRTTRTLGSYRIHKASV